MAKGAPSTKPYRAVASSESGVGDDDDGGGGSSGIPAPVFRDGLGDGLDAGSDPGVIATQSLDLEQEQDRSELRSRERSMRCKLLTSACLLAAVAFGGRAYYVRHNDANGEGNVPAVDGGFTLFGNAGVKGIRGSSNDIIGSSSSEDVGLGGLDLVQEGEGESLDGVEEYEGDVDDEIRDGELEGDFDSDVDYDDSQDATTDGDIDEEDSSDTDDSQIAEDDYYEEDENVQDLEGEEISSSDTTSETEGMEGASGQQEKPQSTSSDTSLAEDEVVNNQDKDVSSASLDEDEASPEEVAEDVTTSSDAPLVEDEAVNGQDEDTPSASLDEEEALPEEVSEDVEDSTEDESEPPASADKDTPDGGEDAVEDELPDYFVPLTPAEREQMKEKLRSTLRATKNALLGKDELNPQRTLVLGKDQPKQFMHMHHMKTGGTSVDDLISCALRRQKELHDGTSVDYNRMSECGSRVRTCMNDLAKKLNASLVDNVFYYNDGEMDGMGMMEGRTSFDPADDALEIPIDELNVCKTSESNVMSYCASLHAVRTFGWHGVDKITVIRNPVDRAWSMYRFSLNRCYKCAEMKDVLRKVASGTFSSKGKGDATTPNFAYSPNDSCAVQMIGHQATNLLSSVELYNVANDVTFPREKEIVEEAVRNLREEFTWIGITDRLQDSIDGMRTVFPFLAENLNDAASEINDVLRNSGEQQVEGELTLPEDYKDKKGCPLQHRNAGRDPTCGTKEMDEETIALVKSLNNRDVAVYKAAVERFELQQEVLEEYRTGSL